MARAEIISLVGEAVGQNRIELYLQPVVTLPQRKVRYYEALMRLRMPDDRIVVAADFLPYAQASGLMPEIDHLMLTRCVRVVRRLQAKNRDVGVFCNLSATTLVGCRHVSAHSRHRRSQSRDRAGADVRNAVSRHPRPWACARTKMSPR